MVKKRIAPKPTPKPLPPEADQWAKESGIDPEIQSSTSEPKSQQKPESEEKSKPFPHRVSFDMDGTQYERLDFASFKTKQSKNKILREALENWLKEKGY